jgi:hypothetical protein
MQTFSLKIFGKIEESGSKRSPILQFFQRLLQGPLHLFQKFCKTIIGIIDSFFHVALEHTIAVSN